MLKKVTLIIIFTFLLSKFASAQEINIDVNGLVCEFCAVTIEKSFKKRTEIEDIKVDLEQKKVFLTFKSDHNISNQTITNIIINNGYNVVQINR